MKVGGCVKMLMFKMKIIDESDGSYFIELTSENETTTIAFNPRLKELNYPVENRLASFFSEHEYQLRTMLHNKRLSSFYVGFELVFVLQIEKDVAAYNDRSKIVVVDRRDGYSNYVLNEGMEVIDKLYTDASFQERFGTGGIAAIHEDLNGNYHLYKEAFENGRGNNVLELKAAIKGMEILQDVCCIRIITDSQYVRKGLSEWLVNWKLNGWMTINGEKAKNVELWQRFEELTDNKYIELEWVKGHTDHFGNTLFDLYAKEIAKVDIK